MQRELDTPQEKISARTMATGWAGSILPDDMETDLVKGFNGLCANAVGRDRMAFTFVFATRGFAGLMDLIKPAGKSYQGKLQEISMGISRELSITRRTHLFFREIPILQSIKSISVKIEDPVCKVFDIFAKLFLSGYCFFDHLGTLKAWRVVPGGQANAVQTILFGYKLYVYSQLCTIFQSIKEFMNESGDDERARKKRFELKKLIIKCVMFAIEYAHLTGQFKTHDAFAGLLGFFSGLHDCSIQWPKKQIKSA